ncbi:MexE family multidrug efflux RND transporter periplasmic adaptor subunit [Kordiimonas sediminis]|uniref:MexE family multidrug efflux RND transporter periplasmic adaptor subunit n=1 Tax=Kordiimonas sediminis TaxID=1735581 RepID=A0A919AQ53_9PROT|nr:efflux RND transporter periplasmic adaptor subunit [Kordiimonas sediminis]GHF17873.1 MexE family multidrug efflux RND transporter periplasmic adaptor subunit [Kordiimonas sediminis]
MTVSTQRIRQKLGIFFLLIGGWSTILSAQQALPVDVATPLTDSVTEYNEYTGRFEAPQAVDIRARVSGYIQEIRFRDGQDVEKGDVLVVIDPRPYRAVVAQARADESHAAAMKKLAELEVVRGESLARTDNIPVDELDRRRANLEAANATLEAARARLVLAELDLEYTEVKAPFDGRLSRKLVDVGALVSGGSSQSMPLVNIVSKGQVHFWFDAPEADYIRFIRLDSAGERVSARFEQKKVFVRLMDEDEWTREGVLDFIDNRISEGAGTMRGRAVFDNAGELLLPGTFGRLRLPAYGPHEVMLLPDSAIVSDQGRKLVYIVGANNIVGVRVVETGPLAKGMRIIRSGISPDQEVIVGGGARIRPGMQVSPTRITLSTDPQTGS